MPVLNSFPCGVCVCFKGSHVLFWGSSSSSPFVHNAEIRLLCAAGALHSAIGKHSLRLLNVTGLILYSLSQCWRFLAAKDCLVGGNIRPCTYSTPSHFYITAEGSTYANSAVLASYIRKILLNIRFSMHALTDERQSSSSVTCLLFRAI